MPRELTAVQVLTVLIQRVEKRAEALDGVKLKEFDAAIYELRNFARVLRAAREYLEKQV